MLAFTATGLPAGTQVSAVFDDGAAGAGPFLVGADGSLAGVDHAAAPTPARAPTSCGCTASTTRRRSASPCSRPRRPPTVVEPQAAEEDDARAAWLFAGAAALRAARRAGRGSGCAAEGAASCGLTDVAAAAVAAFAGGAARRTRRWPTTPRPPRPDSTPRVDPEPARRGRRRDAAVGHQQRVQQPRVRAATPSTSSPPARCPTPASGGETSPSADWSQRAGAASRSRSGTAAAWRPATWAGLSTDSAGNPLGSPTAGTFSNHTFVLSGGTGTVDRRRRHRAPRVGRRPHGPLLLRDVVLLPLRPGPRRGRRRRHADRDRQRLRAPRSTTRRPGRRSRRARSPSPTCPTVDLADERGFVATPAYRGVRVTGVPQNTGGPDAGLVPAVARRLMDDLGTAAFWYSSGAATDPFKVPLPLTVGYDAAVVARADADRAPTKAPIENPVVPPPATVTVTAPIPTSSPPRRPSYSRRWRRRRPRPPSARSRSPPRSWRPPRHPGLGCRGRYRVRRQRRWWLGSGCSSQPPLISSSRSERLHDEPHPPHHRQQASIHPVASAGVGRRRTAACVRR